MMDIQDQTEVRESNRAKWRELAASPDDSARAIGRLLLAMDPQKALFEALDTHKPMPMILAVVGASALLMTTTVLTLGTGGIKAEPLLLAMLGGVHKICAAQCADALSGRRPVGLALDPDFDFETLMRKGAQQ